MADQRGCALAGASRWVRLAVPARSASGLPRGVGPRHSRQSALGGNMSVSPLPTTRVGGSGGWLVFGGGVDAGALAPTVSVRGSDLHRIPISINRPVEHHRHLLP
jgi:hypothetical protein